MRGSAGRGSSALVVAVVMVLTGCAAASDPVARAQSALEAKESALAEAQAELDSSVAEFCGASTAYVEAVDRYGDVLTDSAPTVGDVRTAGADLADPREEAADSAEAVGDAQQEVATAQQELADARRALEEAMIKASSPPPAPAPTPTATTVPVSQTTIARVQQAEADFEATQGSITAETPLAEASEVFHSAAVGLELAWLALLADAGCLTVDEAQHLEQTVAAYVAALQQDLADAGYYAGAIDGIYGPETTAAVEDVQEANGLPVTGTIDQATTAALQAELAAENAAAAQQELATTAAVQQTLRLLGLWDGPVDGVWTPVLTEAVKALQIELGVEPTGEVDAATIAALTELVSTLTLSSPSPSPSEGG